LDLVLEAEARGRDATLIVEDHILSVLLATYTVALAAVAFNFNLNESSHAGIKA